MAFCGECGAQLRHEARFCSTCGATTASPVPANPNSSSTTLDPGRLDTRVRVPAGALVLLGGVLTIAAMFPAYYSHGAALGDSTPTVWYNVPALIVWPLAGVLLLVGRTSGAGAGLAAGSALVWIGAYFGDIGAVVEGQQRAGPGAVLGFIGVAAVTIGGVAAAVAWLLRQPAPRGGGPWWVLAVGPIALVYAVATFANWDTITARITVPNLVFSGINKPELVTRCCTPFQFHGWVRTGDLWVPLAVVAVALAATAIRGVLGTSALIGVVSVAFAPVLYEFADLARAWGPADLRIDAATATQEGLVVTVRPLAGLWLAGAAAALLGLVSLARALHARDIARPVLPEPGPR